MSGTDRQWRDAQDAFARADFDAAIAAADRVIAADAAHAQAHALRANAALKLERWADAVADLDWLLARQPGHAAIRRNLSVCWMRLGNRHKDNGALADADAAYRRALGANPDNADAHFNLGMLLLETRRAAAALEHLQRAVAGEPANLAFALKLAEAHIANDANDAAVSLLERLAAQTSSREQMQQCARLLLRAASPQVAKALAKRLLKAHPGLGAWGREFCRQLRKDSDLAGSRELLALLREHAGDDAERLRIDIASALGLPNLYPDQATLAATRDDYAARLRALVEAYPVDRVACLALPAEALGWDNFLLAYQGGNDRALQSRYGAWSSAALQALLPQFAHARARGARARPRLAMVSSRFHECTVGAYFASWVEHLGRSGWELALVHVGDHRDGLSLRLARAAQHEIALPEAVADAARTLQELDADIILYPELGMDYRTLALAALRLAPIQACAWGHPDTTGLPSIDAFFSCAEMEPADASTHYSETLLALPGLGTRYLSPALPEPATRAAIGLPDRGTLYFVPQSLFKLHPDNDRVYASIARRDPAAKFILFDSPDTGARSVFDARIARAFATAGIEAAGRFVFLLPRPRADYLRVNMACDVMVDTLHFSGGNTSLDALHAGLPIVTCPGRFMRGRQSMAMLRHLDVADLIAHTPDQLAERAVAVANEPPRRAALAQRVRAGLPDLVQSDAPLHALDAHLRALLARR
ncbi:MAG: tetratricopeptide repeat protein [Proteobacteria bacterium]|nr:tetratricopeptide repeat protein [Pseudomonadota bacterium]